MQLHNLVPKTKYRKHRRIGRGGKRGTYSGRGIKGQRARAGARIRPEMRDILKKIPKLRGYKFKSYRLKPTVVNFRNLEKKFKNGDTVSPETLLKAGFIGKVKGRLPKVKILGGGVSAQKFIFKDVVVSKKLSEKLDSNKKVPLAAEQTNF